jgi:hypothetical protein
MNSANSIVQILEKDELYEYKCRIIDTSVTFSIGYEEDGRRVIVFRDESGIKTTAMLFI